MVRLTTNGETPCGFTLIELLVVMAIIATLAAIVAPRYITSVERAKEATLRTNLRLTREAIDKYKGDTGQYPSSLQALVDGRYLHALPIDPITDSTDSWILIAPPGRATSAVFDIRSGASGVDKAGSSYSSW